MGYEPVIICQELRCLPDFLCDLGYIPAGLVCITSLPLLGLHCYTFCDCVPC